MNRSRRDRFYLGIDLGGTKTTVSVSDARGDLRASLRISTEADRGRERVIERLLAACRKVLGNPALRGSPPGSAGVSVPGPLDPEAGVLGSAPNLPGWRDVPLKGILEDALGIPVSLENDANAGALAEWRFGAGIGHRSLVFLTMSTGIGGGVILGGRLLRGVSRNAGEVGHQVILVDGPPCGCGKRGCFEALCSGSGIARRLAASPPPEGSLLRRMRGGKAGPLTAEHLMEAARRSDPFALRFLEETVRYLAIGLANLVFLFDPEILILGTIAVGGWDLLQEPLLRRVREETWEVYHPRLRIVPSKLGRRVETLGPLTVALEAEGRE